jgi:hypothetical protein
MLLSVPNPAIDHRFWGLNDEDSARVVSLYDEARLLMADYNNVQKDIETRQELLRNSWKAKFTDIKLHKLETEMEAAKTSIDRVATECADRQLCPLFTAIILAKLPRELRDHVYDYLWTEEHLESMDKAISFVPNYSSPDESVVSAPELPVPRFANATFVGVDFASEAAARYFRVLSGAELDYRYVRAHIERDHFGPMPFAVKNDIRRLVMKIDESAYPGRWIAPAALTDSMNSLLMLKDHHDISIRVYLESELQWSLAFYQALELIKPVFMMLREINIDIKVLGYDFFSTTEDDDADIFSEQLNHYLTADTPEEWLDMKAREIKEMPRGLPRRRCKRVRNSYLV